MEGLERRVTQLEQLPARIDDLTSQVSQLRTEMRGEFSAVRGEMAKQGAALRAELGALMRVLHEDLVSRLALLQEGQRPRPKQTRSTRKKS